MSHYSKTRHWSPSKPSTGEQMTSIYRSPEGRDHPVVKGTYALYTRPIQEFISILAEWIDEGTPGGYVYGPYRHGKSTAVNEFIKVRLAAKCAGPLPLFTFSYDKHDRFSEHDFLSDLLTASKHNFTEGRSCRVKTERLTNFYATCARNAGGNRVLLVVDEAQRMHGPEYHVLCNLQNRLDVLGYKLTVISVGSHQVAYQHGAFLNVDDLYLAARFFVNGAQFRGIIGAIELEEVLKGYDVDSEWPAGSGTSYTKYFFPKAFEAGFRLSASAAELWSIFEEMGPANPKHGLQVPMQHIARTVEALIRKFSDDGICEPEINRDDLVKAVERTGYRVFMKAVWYSPSTPRTRGGSPA